MAIILLGVAVGCFALAVGLYARQLVLYGPWVTFFSVRQGRVR
ncbi:MAG: hypothetical protein Q6354_09225 [Candidatus Brocadiales bacterium]|nr:hypothetical protein [Candidatus Brocadiales bacterium]